MATQKDVAVRAGVSVATVSMVLAGRDAGRVTPLVRAAVQRAAAELGYVPNLIARGLKTRRTHTIGLLSDAVASTPFAGQLLAGAQQEAWNRGYLLLSIDTGGDHALDAPAIQALTQRHIDALVYACMYHREVQLPPLPAGLPVVILDGRPANEDDGRAIDWVVPDEVGGARAAVEELIRAGHSRIGFCTQRDDVPATRGRLAGYIAAHRDAGLDVDESLIVAADDNTAPHGANAAAHLLRRPDRPTGLFCFSDRIAMGAYRAARALDLGVPSDLSIVGFDNQEFVADSLAPPLTTIQLPHFEMGRWSAQAVLRRLSGDDDPQPRIRVMPAPLIRRGSVQTPNVSRLRRQHA
ncbi:LacI family DNA-binding transcriptional regulator [Micromonospora sp. NPDC048830]|uniref:LacI family DNA-binding transcriptional regulator n=1 Tax=Micromonospora sp. NPDC048830 TaxID=3364257 RepID=UPI0037241CBE